MVFMARKDWQSRIYESVLTKKNDFQPIKKHFPHLHQFRPTHKIEAKKQEQLPVDEFDF